MGGSYIYTYMYVCMCDIAGNISSVTFALKRIHPYILYRNNVDKIERNGIKFVLPESKYQMDGVRKNDIEFFKYQS